MRVVAGKFRGRTLRAPRGEGTRPTAARAKEALFAVLGAVEGLRVLDLYAGSGALGIEALSRGALHAVFVEASRPALLSLRENLAALGIGERAEVLPMRVESAGSALGRMPPFELVFCDPPWKEAAQALKLLERLATAGVVQPGARVALEHAARDANTPLLEPSPESPLRVSDQRRWGDTSVTLLDMRSEPGDPAS
jgi:16S rRNA (guanine966-N2)-methyltransferase